MVLVFKDMTGMLFFFLNICFVPIVLEETYILKVTENIPRNSK